MFALYLLGTEMSSVDEAWFGKIKEQTLYWVLNGLLTNVHLSITCLIPRRLDFPSDCLGTRLEHYSVAVMMTYFTEVKSSCLAL